MKHSIMPTMLCLFFSAGEPAWGQDFDSGSTGADGALDLTGQSGDVIFDLNEKSDGVYHYTTINIPIDVTVKFANNAANTPVTWLATGDVVIDGQIDLDGKRGHDNGGSGYSIPGPGGFAGGGKLGADAVPTAGLGPGAGRGTTVDADGDDGSFATRGDGDSGPIYGNQFLLPLIGGSGGASAAFFSGATIAGGGAGGGAILIASSSSILVNGEISARGGSGGATGVGPAGGGGSGGAIRLIADEVTGFGSIEAVGRRGGGNGRIRIEAFRRNLAGFITPAASVGLPGLLVVPPGGPFPTLTATMVDAVAVPASPNGNVFAQPDVTINSAAPVSVAVQATNIPVGTVVELRVAGESGAAQLVNTTPLAGTFESSTADADVTFASGVSHVTLRALFDTNGAGAMLPIERSERFAQRSKRRSVGQALASISGWVGRVISGRGADEPAARSSAVQRRVAGRRLMTINGRKVARVEVTSNGSPAGTHVVYLTEDGRRHRIPSR